MKIILRNSYNANVIKEFNNKERLISSINNILGLRDWENIFFYAKQDGFSQDINKWTIEELVKMFYGDYKIIERREK